VTNAGLITAAAVGITFASAVVGSGTVTNSGTISATTGASNSNTLIFTAGGRVQNSGIITNAGAASSSSAINIGNGPGTITNQAGALISAAGVAIGTGTVGGASNITNYGTIISTAALPAISLRAGGTIVNGTSPGAGALITGNGIFISGAAGTISNFGTISSTLNGGAGVNISSGTVSNSGLISGSATGVNISGSGATVVNSGSIPGTGSGASGVRLSAGGSLNNSGVITSLASGAGTVNGSGVFLASGGTLSNSGTISNPGANNGNGVQVGTGGGYINNSGLITAYHDGVGFFNSGTLRLVNPGTIRSTGTSPVGPKNSPYSNPKTVAANPAPPTNGHADTSPATLTGRFATAILAFAFLGALGLWTCLMASGFVTENERENFLRNWDLISRVPLFRSLGPAAISEVAAALRPWEAPERTIVFREGRPGDSMYFIVSGAVRVHTRPEPVDLRDGSFFGEMALLGDGVRSATISTIEPSSFLVLDVADFRRIMASNPELAAAIDAESARRREEARRLAANG